MHAACVAAHSSEGQSAADYKRYPEPEMLARAEAFYDEMNRRRTTRHFSSEPVPRRLTELAMLTAGTAPSGAHRQR